MIRQMYDPFNSVMYGFDDSIISMMVSQACYTKAEVDSKISSVFKICGEKATVSELPATGSIGDVWIITETHDEYTWVKAGRWEQLGPLIDTSAFATVAWVKEYLGQLPSQYNSFAEYLTALAQGITSANNKAQTALDKANAAVTNENFESFKSQNTQAINNAKKAGTDAQATANTAKSTADAALPKTEFETFKSSNTTAINAAKKSGDDAAAAVNSFKEAQLVFETTVASIEKLDGSVKVVTQDAVFSRRKTYYKLVEEEYVPLVLGTDYLPTLAVADFEGTVYEDRGVSVNELIGKINELVDAGNMLIAAHKQEAAANEGE